MNNIKENLVLYFGNDEFSVSKTAKEWLKQHIPEERLVTSLEQLDGEVTTIDAAVENLERAMGCLKEMDLFGDQKFVWIRHTTFLGTTGPGKSDVVKAKLKLLAQCFENGLTGSNCLLITSSQVDKRGAFYKFVKKMGTEQEFNIPEKTYQAEQHARHIAQDMFKREKLRISGHCLQAFVEKTGFDTRQIHQEVCKLATYLEEGTEVHLNDIKAIVTSTREAMAWDLSDALGEGKLGEALENLKLLLAQKVSEVGLIMQLNRRFRELLILRECLDRGWLRLRGGGNFPKAIWMEREDIDQALENLQELNPKKIHSFRLARLTHQARHFSLQTLEECRHLLLDAQWQIRSKAVPSAFMLELLLLRICGIQHSGRRRV